jgi:translation initiation factor eIF-2B subunit delta
MNVSPSVTEILKEIRSDNLSGASQLAEKTARFLLDFLRDSSEEELLLQIRTLSRALVDTQPSMAPIVNLVDHLFQATKGLDDSPEIKEKGILAIEGFLEGLTHGAERIITHALPLLRGKRTLLTHSYSATVLRVLECAKAVEVICTEARPLFEGTRTAKELGKRGINVRLVVDFAAFSLVRECDLVIVGADAITPGGIVNKIGTYGLALVAKEEGVPFYVLAGKEKYLPSPFSYALRIDKQDPKEVIEEAIINGVVENFYFDLTPLNLISGVVTQDGVMSGQEVQESLDKMEISKELTKL